jgi:chromate transporter
LSLRSLSWLVARDVNRTLGGGLASMELLRRTFTARGLLDDRGNAGLVAVSRLTPGTVVLAYCVALGWLLHGWAGAAAALAAASVPTSVVIVIASAALDRFHEMPVVRMALAVGVCVATALVFSSAWYLLRPYVRGTFLARAALIALLATSLVAAGVPPVRILLLSAIVGALLGAPARSPEAP